MPCLVNRLFFRRSYPCIVFAIFLSFIFSVFTLNGCSQAGQPVKSVSAQHHENVFKFAVLCDTRSDANKSGEYGVNTAAVQAISHHIKAQGAEFVLAPGDLICGNVSWYTGKENPTPTLPGNKKQLNTFLQAALSQGVGLPGSSATITLYPVRGNHESYHQVITKKKVEEAWSEVIGNTMPTNGPEGEKGFTYAFRRHNNLFIGLEQYINADVEEKNGIGFNDKWLQDQIAANPKVEHVFVFGHTPAFSAHHQDCLAENSGLRNSLMRTVKKGRGIYFCGHDHFYARAMVPVYDPNNITINGYIQQIITPSGAPFLTGNRSDNHKWDGRYQNCDVKPRTYIDNSMGYQLVTVEGPKITVQYFATMDGASYSRDEETGAYSYEFNSKWQEWTFAVMDQFTLPAMAD